MTPRFVALDGIRGLAALAVAAFHFSPTWAGYLAVDLFFVLSGFILAHVYFFADHPTPFRTFLIHRIARLYPLHLFTLVTFVIAFVIVSGAAPEYPDGTLFVLIQNLTLTNNVGLNPSSLTYNFASWSISVEFWINVVFFVGIAALSKPLRLIVGALVCLALLRYASPDLDVTYQNVFGVVNLGLIRGVASFCLGIVCYQVFDHAQTTGVSKRWSDLRFTAMEGLSIAALAFVFLARDEMKSQLDFLAPLVCFAMIAVFSFERGVMSRVLVRFAWLGDLSYSVYLNHLTVLLLLRYALPTISGVAFLLIYLGVVLAYSKLTYHVIEVPARRWIRARMTQRAVTG